MIVWRDLRTQLEQRGISPRKSLGQNFITDPGILERIVNFLAPEEDDIILEIGSGPGTLTRALAGYKLNMKERNPGRPGIIAVEIDGRLLEAAREIMGADTPGVMWVRGDFLDLDDNAIWNGTTPLRAKAVGNLPYGTAMPMLFKLLDMAVEWKRMALMFQREVAERIVSGPGTSDFGVPSVRVGVRFKAKIAEVVPPSAFWPNPKVESAVVVFKPRQDQKLMLDTKIFKKVVDAGFSTRRKMLVNCLSADVHGFGLARDRWIQIIEELGLDPKIRAERLHPDDFVSLSNALYEERIHRAEAGN